MDHNISLRDDLYARAVLIYLRLLLSTIEGSHNFSLPVRYI